MAVFDIIVIVIVGTAMVAGILRGFVREVISLGAWFAAIAAIYLFHTQLTTVLFEFFGDNGLNAGLIAFAVLMFVPYVVMKLLARWAGGKIRGSVLSAIDRLLGLGFGAVKGVIVVVLGFSMVALLYDTVWSAKGHPDWIKDARSYPLVNAASNALVVTIAERREELFEEE